MARRAPHVLGPLGRVALMVVVGGGLALWAPPAQCSQLLTSAPLPVEGKAFRIVYQTDAVAVGQTAAFKVMKADGSVVREASVPLAAEGGAAQAALELTVPKNGMLRATVKAGGKTQELPIPVITAKREVHLIYYGVDPAMLTDGLVRYMTLVTSCPDTALTTLNERGIKPLSYSYGSNAVNDRAKDLASKGLQMTEEMAEEMGRVHYTKDPDKLLKQGYAGDGIDEFVGYTASDAWRGARAFLRGMIEARKKDLPPGFLLAGWTSNPLDPELVGIFKQAVDFVLPEAYEMEICPKVCGTDRQDRDMEGRLINARANDMFTGPYGEPCRIIPCIDVTDRVPVDQYEGFFRMYRREFPEVRGIGFFNVLSKPKWPVYRVIDRLCYDYFVCPVVTFEPDSVGLDRFGKGGVIAYLSNVGAMDSGRVAVRLLVDGKEAGRATVASVPAGFSRMDDRAPVRFNWKPTRRGTYRLRVEITDCPDATVLEPAVEKSFYCQP